MLILNETNYSNGKVTLYDNENNVVSNGHVDIYVGIDKVSTFSLDVYGQGTPSITAGIFYRFEVFDSVGELVSILEPVSLGESSGGGVTPTALEAETAARIAGDESLQGQINGKADKSYVDDKFGQITYDKRVIEAKINEETSRAKDAEKTNADAIEEASDLLGSHVSDKSNPHEVTAEQIGAAKSTDLAAYVKKTGDTMTGRLTVQTAGGDQTKAAEGAMVVKMTAAANKTGVSTNGSVFAGDLDNTNSNFVGVRRKTDSGAKVGARFQIYRRSASDNGTAAFMQVDYTSTATTKSVFEFGHNYGTNEDNWGTMTFGDVTKNIAYKEDFDTALNDSSESAPQTKVVYEKIKAVTDLIPTAATPANQLADKAYVDFGVEQMAAKYLSATADGQPFSSYAQFQQGVFYYGGEVTEPTKNDYALVNGDETHDNAVTRYVFTTEWNFQYVVNNSPLNAEQLAALNSGINATKVGNYDSHIADTTKHITEAERTKWNGYEKGKANATHTHTASQVSGLAAVATSGSYNDLTGKPTIPADSGLVHITGTETITGVKNFTSASGTFQGKCYKDVNGRWIVPENGALVCDLGAPYLCEWVTVKSSYGSQLEYIKYENVLYEKTFDGESWETYSVPEINHKRAWSLGNSGWGSITIGSSAGQRGIRITITAPKYTWLDQLYMYADRGSTYQKIIIEKQLNSSGDWSTVTESGYNGGDPAHYVLRFPFITFNTAQASQYGKIRITILDREQSTRDHSISKIGLFGGYPYYTPKEYTISEDKNFQFYGTLYVRNGTSSNYRVFDTSQIIPIANGGTGASTAAEARTNLGLGSLATKNNVTNSDISGTIADSHIASASTWNGKQDALSYTTPAEITEILGGLE